MRFVFAALLWTAISAYGQTVALVTDLSGKAAALSAAPSTLGILSEIQADTQVKLEGELAVLYYGTGEEFSFRGPATIAFGKSGPKVLQGAPPKLARQAKGPAVKPGGVAPATFVMRSLVPPELRARIEAARPAPGAPVSERVAFAAWLEQLELRNEAKDYWKALAAERPDSAKLKELSR